MKGAMHAETQRNVSKTGTAIAPVVWSETIVALDAWSFGVHFIRALESRLVDVRRRREVLFLGLRAIVKSFNRRTEERT